ncbi:RICIN domain-containing protein [Plantactinospora sp. CA-290183]|uniref:RICIN domain-containing protein n=1 Tax=Plantactinospora sp. CA-290183 TaxID=3240006 RepID=UPI003D92944A
MPEYDIPGHREPTRSPGGTVYGRRRRPDPLLLAALAVGATGVLLGVLFATGLLTGGDGTPSVAGLPTPGTDRSPSASGGAAAGSSTPGTTPGPTPTPSTAPTLGPTDVRVLRSAVSGLCLDVLGTGNPEGAAARQAACTGAPSQRWQPTPVGPDVVTLVNTASGKCLDVYGVSRDDGAAVQQWSCNGGANQQWRLVPAGTGPAAGTGPVALVSVNSGKCLDLPDANPGPGVPLRQLSCLGTPNQQWTQQPN